MNDLEIENIMVPPEVRELEKMCSEKQEGQITAMQYDTYQLCSTLLWILLDVYPLDLPLSVLKTMTVNQYIEDLFFTNYGSLKLGKVTTIINYIKAWKSIAYDFL